jgi:hypothetical protein
MILGAEKKEIKKEILYIIEGAEITDKHAAYYKGC